jgi:acyl carrier protein
MTLPQYSIRSAVLDCLLADADGYYGNVTPALIERRVNAHFARKAMKQREQRADAAAQIERQVIRVVAAQMGEHEETVTRDTHLADDLHADSLDAIELVMQLEDAFDIAIPDEDAEKLLTVGQIVDHVRGKLAPSYTCE